MVAKETFNETLADAVLDRPREFFIGNKRFCLWSPTLGSSIIISRHIAALGIDDDICKVNPNIEALRLVNAKRENVCYLIALHTFRRFEDICNSNIIKRRSELLSKNLNDEEIASLLILILTAPRIESFLSLSGIEEQQKKQAEIARIKSDSSTITFGGQTIYGSLIAPACEKLNLTPNQVVWEISLINLRMLMADAITSVYLSEDDKKKFLSCKSKAKVYGMDSASIKALKSMDWS